MEKLLEKYGLQIDQNGLELFFVSRLSINSFLRRLFRLTNLRCILYSIPSFFDLDFISLFS